MTFRTTLRETRKSRQIALIVIFREKYARRILPIVSTISISNSASQKIRRPVWTLIPGVPIGCRSPRKRGPYSTPNDTLRHRPDPADTGEQLRPVCVAKEVVAAHLSRGAKLQRHTRPPFPRRVRLGLEMRERIRAAARGCRPPDA